MLTGPSNPQGESGSFFFHSRQLVKVRRPVGLGLPSLSHAGHDLRVPFGLRSLSSGNCSSPICRLIQRLTTLISSVFLPALIAVGHVDAIGRFPKDAERFAVECDLRHDLDATEVQDDFGFPILDVGLEGGAVSGRAGVVFDFLLPDASTNLPVPETSPFPGRPISGRTKPPTVR